MADDRRVTVRVVGMPGLRRKLAQVADAVAGDALRRALLAGALPIQNAAKIKAPKRTRTLSRSIHSEATIRSKWDAQVAIGTNLEYAAIQEFGGTIVPRKAKFLAIPLTDEARQYTGPRQFPRPLKPRIKGGKGVLLDDAGIAQFALVKRVTLRARPYLRPAFDENLDAAVAEVAAVLRMQLGRVVKT